MKGLEMLCRLDHRAGRGSDGKTGDGAGLMVQIPDAFSERFVLSGLYLNKDATASGCYFYSRSH